MSQIVPRWITMLQTRDITATQVTKSDCVNEGQRLSILQSPQWHALRQFPQSSFWLKWDFNNCRVQGIVFSDGIGISATLVLRYLDEVYTILISKKANISFKIVFQILLEIALRTVEMQYMMLSGET